MQSELVATAPVKRQIVVPGDPTPWERAGERIAHGAKGPGFRGPIKGYVWRPWISHYTPKQTEEAEAAIAHYWRKEGHPTYPSNVPLVIRCLFVFARPSGHYGTGRNAGHVKPQHLSARPGGRGNRNANGQRTGGDFDNLVKLVCDALNGVAYADDGQICEDGGTKKLFVDQLGVRGPATLVELWEAA